MRAEDTRRGGLWVAFERGANETDPADEAVPVSDPVIVEPRTPATAPMFEHARIQAGAVLVLARVCEVSVVEFVRRYA